MHAFAGGVVPDRSDLPAQQWVIEHGALIHRLALEPAPGDTVHEWYTTTEVDWDGLADRSADVGTDWAPQLSFVGDPITGRVCGRFGERVVYKSQSCMIERVDWITPDEHAKLLRGDRNPANDVPETTEQR